MSSDRNIRVLLVEDEAVARRRLSRLARVYFGSRIVRIDEAASVEDAQNLINEVTPDLLLLDLELQGQSGYALLHQGAPPTIIVSANVHRALEAFEHNVIDFVSKPVMEGRLGKAFERFDELGDRLDHRRFAVIQSGRVRLVPLTRIFRFSAADDYVEVILEDGSSFLHDGRLSAVELQLPDTFVRVHRSHIVNSRHITQLVRRGHGAALLLDTGDQVPVSASRYRMLWDALSHR